MSDIVVNNSLHSLLVGICHPQHSGKAVQTHRTGCVWTHNVARSKTWRDDEVCSIYSTTIVMLLWWQLGQRSNTPAQAPDKNQCWNCVGWKVLKVNWPKISVCGSNGTDEVKTLKSPLVSSSCWKHGPPSYHSQNKDAQFYRIYRLCCNFTETLVVLSQPASWTHPI